MNVWILRSQPPSCFALLKNDEAFSPAMSFHFEKVAAAPSILSVIEGPVARSGTGASKFAVRIPVSKGATDSGKLTAGGWRIAGALNLAVGELLF